VIARMTLYIEGVKAGKLKLNKFIYLTALPV
jgi:hypothetical protein